MRGAAEGLEHLHEHNIVHGHGKQRITCILYLALTYLFILVQCVRAHMDLSQHVTNLFFRRTYLCLTR